MNLENLEIDRERLASLCAGYGVTRLEVQPFPCSTPHTYSINIMTQGGASGSPVFSCETGEVVGVLCAGLRDIARTVKAKEPYWVPTNISYVVPSHYLRNALAGIENQAVMRLDATVKTLDQILAEGECVNAYERGRLWEKRTVDPQTEAERVKSLTRLSLPDKDAKKGQL